LIRGWFGWRVAFSDGDLRVRKSSVSDKIKALVIGPVE